MIPKLVSIGGSDTWGGGGIQTDLKTFENLHVFGLTVLTCLAVESSDGFTIKKLASALVQQQLQTIEHAFQLNGVKIGLLADLETIDLVVDFCKRNQGKMPIVLDPVMAFKETKQHLQTDYVEKIRTLLPFVDLITPNLTEAAFISGCAVPKTVDDLSKLSQIICQDFPSLQIVIKGGQQLDSTNAIDFYRFGNETAILSGPLSKKKTTNGAGCCFSSAICAYLAKGFSPVESIQKSKTFVYEAIEQGIAVGAAGNAWHQTAVKED